MTKPEPCSVTGCAAAAAWCPELHLWPRGYPRVERYRATLRLHARFCGAHRRQVTNDMMLTDAVWSSIANRIEALGRLGPDPAAVELHWQMIAAGEAEGRIERSGAKRRPAAGWLGQSLRILVIEDEVLIALGIGAELTAAGHIVIGPAATLDKALALAEADRPDFALVDISLRGRDDGLEAARTLTQRHSCPCLFLTARPVQAYANQDAALGMIVKPAEPGLLLAAIAISLEILNGGSDVQVPSELILFDRS